MITVELNNHEFAALLRQLALGVGMYAHSGVLSTEDVAAALRDEASRLAELTRQYMEACNGPR